MVLKKLELTTIHQNVTKLLAWTVKKGGKTAR